MAIIYKIYKVPVRLKKLEEELNRLSELGWRIACSIKSGKVLILKTKIKPKLRDLREELEERY